MDLLTNTEVSSEVASDFHTEPEGEGRMFSKMSVPFATAA
jgi:hypothetical protein